jgi:hypothetical protein
MRDITLQQRNKETGAQNGDMRKRIEQNLIAVATFCEMMFFVEMYVFQHAYVQCVSE